MIEFFTRPHFLVVLCAVAYAVATFAMKLTATSPAPVLFAIIVACLFSAVVAEVLLMRQFTIGLAYIAIIAAETLLVLGFAVAIGEGLGVKQIFGALMVISGVVLVSA